MRLIYLSSTFLFLFSCSSLKETSLDWPKKNYILVQAVETTFMGNSKGSYNMSQALGGVYGATGAVIGIIIDESVKQDVNPVLLKINYDLKKYGVDNILKKSLGLAIKEASGINVVNEFSLVDFNSKWAKAGNDIIQLNYQYKFDERMDSIQVIATLKFRKVIRIYNRGKYKKVAKYETYYENKYKFISDRLSNDNGVDRIIATREKVVYEWYETELKRLNVLKSSRYKARKKTKLGELYRKKIALIYSKDEDVYKKESLINLWSEENSLLMKSVFDKAAQELSRMIEIDLATYELERTGKSYKRLEPFTDRFGLIESSEGRAIVIERLYNFCSIPLTANPKRCY